MQDKWRCKILFLFTNIVAFAVLIIEKCRLFFSINFNIFILLFYFIILLLFILLLFIISSNNCVRPFFLENMILMRTIG